MRRLVIAALAGVLMLPWTIPASGSEPNCQVGRDTGWCRITATDPGSPSTPERPPHDPARPVTDQKPAKKPDQGSACTFISTNLSAHGTSYSVPCATEKGIWRNNANCYMSRTPLDPQPPASSPDWGEHAPGDGAIYACYNVAGWPTYPIWSAEPPDAADVGPSPGEVAQVAVERMDLRAVEIGMSPDPDGPGVVALPTWLWVQDPGEQTFGPITRTASAGSVTVTATARVERIVWDMGDGTQVVCTGPGTPYESRFGRKASPDCGHTYTRESGYQPGQEYTVTATSEWVVDWEGAGQSGSLDVQDLSRSVQVSVGEAQVLVN